MSVEMLEGYTTDYIERFSQQNNEPDWMKTLRFDALKQAEQLEMPKANKTKINRWDFSTFSHEGG